MKHVIILSVMCVLMPLSGYAESPFNRIGIVLGGTTLLSFSYEHHFSKYSMRVNVGTSKGEISMTAVILRFFSKSSKKPFIGIGGWNSVVFYKGIEHINLITAPVGIDWKISNKKYLGLECDMHYFLTGRHHDGSKVEFNSPILHKNFLIFPALYYKHRLSK